MGVAVHRVALPDDLVSGALDLLDDGRQQIADLVIAQPADQGQPARLVVRVKPLDVLDSQFGGHRRTHFDPDRVGDHLGEADVSAIELAGALTDPHIVCGQVVEAGLAEFLAEPQHRPFVVDHQRLVAGVDVGGVQIAVIDAARRHEAQAAVDLTRQGLVTSPCRGSSHELPVPVVHQMQ